MTLRANGSYIGARDSAVSTTAASGVWDLRTAQRYQAEAAWPVSILDPSIISGLQLWLDASDSSTLYDATTGGSLVAADGTVKRWEDKSGNDRHATEGTNGPQRKTAIQGGLDVLRFDGSNDFLSVPSSTATFKFLHAEQATVFIAIKVGTSANPNVSYRIMANWSSSGTPGVAIIYDDRGAIPANDRLQILSHGAGVFPIVSNADDVIPAQTFAALSIVLNNTAASAADRVLHARNGTLIASTNSSTAARSTSNAQHDLTIGRIPTGTQYLPGDIAEILIYNSALSDADREAVENYLLAKWGIA